MPEQKKVICRVLRAFKFEGKVIEAGKTIELPENLAHELQSASKVSFNGADAPGKQEAVDPMSAAKSGKSK